MDPVKSKVTFRKIEGSMILILFKTCSFNFKLKFIFRANFTILYVYYYIYLGQYFSKCFEIRLPIFFLPRTGSCLG